MRYRWGLLAFVLGAGACHPGWLAGEGAPCSATHPCGRPFLACVSGICQAVAPASTDGSRDTTDAADVANVGATEAGADASHAGADVAEAGADAGGADAAEANTTGADAADSSAADARDAGAAGDAAASDAVDAALVSVGAAWPEPFAPYCWEIGKPAAEDGAATPANANPLFPFVRQVVADVISETWAGASNLQIPDQGDCLSAEPAANPRRISIWLRPGPPNAEAGFRYDRARRIGLDPTSLSLSYDIIDALAAALGVNARTAPGTRTLSPEQIVAVRSVYGAKPAGSLAVFGDFCLDLPSGISTAGTLLQTFPCHGDANQLWRWTSAGSLVVSYDAHACTASLADPTLPAGFTQAGIASCDASDDQRLSLSGVAWRGFGDLCVAIAGAAQPGAALVLAACGPDAPLAIWDVPSPGGGAPRLSGTGLCVQAAPAAAASAPLQLAPCADAAAGAFTWLAAGQLHSADRCAQSAGDLPAAGTPLVWGACSTDVRVPQQQTFHFTGPVHDAAGNCLQVLDPLPTIHSPVVLGACDAGLTGLVWDFYPLP